jgi:hypothetical protein
MGRPVNKKYFGAVVNGVADGNFSVIADTGNGVAEDAVIIKQRSSVKFLVDDAPGASGTQLVCKLVDKAVASVAEGEMVIQGFITGGEGANTTNVKRLYNRICHGFDGKKYKWAIVDDSTQNYLELTAI